MDIDSQPGYQAWVDSYDTMDEKDGASIRLQIDGAVENPLFSVIFCPSNIDSDQALLLIQALQRQIYPWWEVWLPCQPPPQLPGDARIRVLAGAHSEDGWLSAALGASGGRLILPLMADAVPREHAFFELAAALKESPAALIFFADEDQITNDGTRCRPHFKTAWDPDLMLGRDEIGVFAAYDPDILRSVARRFNGSRADLALRATAATVSTRIRHIAAILCHRKATTAVQGASEALLYREAVTRHLRSIGDGSDVVPSPLAPQFYRIVRPVPSPAPLVSIIIPTKNHADLLARSASAVLSRTDYPNVELLIVDNGSSEPDSLALLEDLSRDPRVRILSEPGSFNYSAMNNKAARAARGSVLVLLNNDTDVLDVGWLREMVSHAVREDVGIVGAKLFYEDGHVQHAGVVFDRQMEVIHQLRLSEGEDPGPGQVLALTRTVSAVTGACQCMRKSVFFEIGQLDDQHLSVQFNDIDLCLRAADHGYRVVFTPFARLTHFECASRGPDHASGLLRENYFKERRWFESMWGTLLANDPFHNPNISYGWNETRMACPPARMHSWLKQDSTRG